MPTYCLVCEKCDHEYEEFRWISEGMPEACPNCGEAFGEHFHQNWKENRPLGLCKGEDRITTVGQQAEYNAKRTGKEKMQLMLEEEKKAKSGWHGKLPPGCKLSYEQPETPWWRDGSVEGVVKQDKPIDISKIPDPKRYIETGK